MKTGSLFSLVTVLFTALRIVLGQNTLLLNKYILNKQRNVYEGQANQRWCSHDKFEPGFAN